MKVIIANNIKDYMNGKCDGIIFTNVEDKDVDNIKRFATKYNKEIQIMDSIISTYDPNSDSKTEDTPQQLVASKKKKVWINNGKETKRINEDELQTYLSNGYKLGKKK